MLTPLEGGQDWNDQRRFAGRERYRTGELVPATARVRGALLAVIKILRCFVGHVSAIKPPGIGHFQRHESSTIRPLHKFTFNVHYLQHELASQRDNVKNTWLGIPIIIDQFDENLNIGVMDLCSDPEQAA